MKLLFNKAEVDALLAEKDREIEKLNMEIQGYQIDSGYQKGKDNMEAAMMKHLEDFKYPGGNSEFDQELKAKIDEVIAQLNSSEPNACFLDKIEAFSKKHPDIFNDEPTYPCQECGLLRTEAQGGTTFTVCDACWDKHYKNLNSGDPLPGK